MNRLITTFITAILVLCTTTSFAQKKGSKKDYNTYYVTKALEEFNKSNLNNAIELAQLELKTNPDNCRAYLILSLCYINQNDISSAMSNANKGLDYADKKDKRLMCDLYHARGKAYSMMGDTAKALVDIDKSLSFSKQTYVYEERLKIYGAQSKYDLAAADAKMIIDLDPADYNGYYYLGMCYDRMGDTKEAIQQFTYAVNLSPDTDNNYIERAACYKKTNSYPLAARDYVTAIGAGEALSPYKLNAITSASLVMMPQLEKELRRIILLATDEQSLVYRLYLAECYRINNMEEKAIPQYDAITKVSADPNIFSRMALCYSRLCQFDEALECINKAAEINAQQNTDGYNKEYYDNVKVSILDDAGRGKEALAILDTIIENGVPDALTYSRRAWIRQYEGDFPGAIEDFTKAISMDPDNQVHSVLNRGNLRRLSGDEEGAREDFEYIINYRNDNNQFSSNSMFAYFYLGNNEKALQGEKALLEKNPEAGDFYNAACLESLMENKEKALAFMDSAFTKGYTEFHHISRDRDLDYIRSTQELQDMISHYKSKLDEKRKNKGLMLVKSTAQNSQEEKTVEIPFTKDGNMCKVKCTINGLPLHFIFDTGASDVSISSVEASFMFKNEYLSRNDIRGSQNYMNANGEISTGTVINLRTVKLNDELELNDIRASVAHNQSAPLLLGQSVLERLGKIEIDNDKKVLRITYTSKK